jgi:hypothetical protein
LTAAAALLAHALRARLRSPGAGALLVLAGGALVAATLARAGGGAGDPAALADAFLVAGLAAAFAAAATGGVLPDDRASGRAEWLATLRPSGAAHRLATAAAGALLAVVAATAAAGLAAAVLALSGRAVPTFATTPLPLGEEGGAVLARLPEAAPEGSRVVEWDVAPRIRDLSREPPATIGARVTWRVGDVAGTRALEVPLRGSVRVEVPSRARVVSLAPADASAAVLPRAVAARTVEGRRPFAASVALAGLLIGVGCACAAPLAVLVSRATSAPTAALAAAVAVVVGVARDPLLAVAADVAGSEAAARSVVLRLGAGVVRLAALAAPDLRALGAVEGAAAGRAVSPSAFSGLWPALLHAAVASALLAVPGPRRRR